MPAGSAWRLSYGVPGGRCGTAAAAYDTHSATQAHERPENEGIKVREEEPTDPKRDQADCKCTGKRAWFIRGGRRILLWLRLAGT